MIAEIKGVETAKPIKKAGGKSGNNRKTCGKMSVAVPQLNNQINFEFCSPTTVE